MNYHDDIYLWSTIKGVLKNNYPVEIRERVYKEFENRTWTVEEIERFAIGLV